MDQRQPNHHPDQGILQEDRPAIPKRKRSRMEEMCAEEVFYRTLQPPCPECGTTGGVKFRYFNNRYRTKGTRISSFDQPCYRCCGEHFIYHHNSSGGSAASGESKKKKKKIKKCTSSTPEEQPTQMKVNVAGVDDYGTCGHAGSPALLPTDRPAGLSSTFEATIHLYNVGSAGN